MNRLYYGNNLHVLRDRANFPDACVDLIYLDPPFNSKRDYNLLFKSPKAPAAGGEAAYGAAQIEAFLDTWHWTQDVAEQEYDEIVKGPQTEVAKMMIALLDFLGRNDMTAYLVMMARRLLELHRVLKPTGSLYLHCDPTAAHYLKIVLDAVFGAENFRSEIIWRRSGAHNSARRYGPIHDTIFFYSKTENFCWNRIFSPYASEYIKTFFNKQDAKGRFRTQTLTGAGTRNGESGRVWRNYDPTAKGRHWAFPGSLADELAISELSLHEKLDYLADHGLLVAGDWLPEYRQYLNDSPGVPIQDIWAYQPFTSGSLYGTAAPTDHDVRWISDRNDPERLGYPTQKPLGLLQRIIRASSNPGDVVLDPFCGCGTAVHAAQKLQRRWVGIDITCLAISLIESRLQKAFPEQFGEKGKRLAYDVIGTPKDLESARDLARRDKYQFQWWAVSLIDEAQPWQGKKKGADTGIDGIRYFRDLDRKEVHTMLLSVKGGENVGPAMVKDLIATLARDGADIGLFITLAAPTKAMIAEAAAAGFYESPNGKKYPRLQPLTIAGLLDGTQRALHPDYEPDLGYKKAKAEASGEQSTLL